eukprot:scaffold53835_cov57-Phaeocystis_antarctica.AAC.2
MGTVATVGAVRQRGQSGPLAVPQLGSCACSGRAWRLRAAPGSSGRLETPRARGRPTGRHATASQPLERALSEPPPKWPIPPLLTTYCRS